MIKPRLLGSFRRVADLAIPRSNFFLSDGLMGGNERSEAPLHPRAFASLLAQRTFTNGADCEVVADLYADTLAGAFGGATELIFSNCDWGDEDVMRLAEVLPMAGAATLLGILGNHYGERRPEAEGDRGGPLWRRRGGEAPG